MLLGKGAVCPTLYLAQFLIWSLEHLCHQVPTKIVLWLASLVTSYQASLYLNDKVWIPPAKPKASLLNRSVLYHLLKRFLSQVSVGNWGCGSLSQQERILTVIVVFFVHWDSKSIAGEADISFSSVSKTTSKTRMSFQKWGCCQPDWTNRPIRYLMKQAWILYLNSWEHLVKGFQCEFAEK